MKIMATSFKRSHAHTAALSAPDPAAGHRRPMPLLETPGYTGKSGSVVCEKMFSFQLQRKEMPKNVQTTAQLHSSHTLAK